jgi:hypothetical protein
MQTTQKHRDAVERWRARNPDKVRAYKTKWLANNPERRKLKPSGALIILKK